MPATHRMLFLALLAIASCASPPRTRRPKAAPEVAPKPAGPTVAVPEPDSVRDTAQTSAPAPAPAPASRPKPVVEPDPPQPRQESIALAGEWRFKFDASVKKGRGAAHDGWETHGFDDNNWARIQVGRSWEEQGWNKNGIGWYRKTFSVPAEWKGRDLVLLAGRPDDGGEAYFNGSVLGNTNAFGEWLNFGVPAKLVRFGEANTVAVRVWDWYKGGGLSDGTFALVKPAPFSHAPAAGAQGEARELRLSVDRDLEGNLMSDPRWQYGWRDEGLADTRPKMHTVRGGYEGGDAIAMNAWEPNSSGEFVDYRLGADEGGTVWRERGYEYLCFKYMTSDTGGEIHVAVNKGDKRWKKNVPSYGARVFVEQGGWRTVILPFSAFTADGRSMNNPTGLDTLSLGYRNHELRKPGTVRFADFRVGRFDVAPVGRAVGLDGYWRFRRDDTWTDGKPINWKDQAQREGAGVKLGYHTKDFDDSSWSLLKSGMHWERQGHRYNGPAWYRQRVYLPASWKGRPLVLRMGKPDDRGELYVNGAMVQEYKKYGSFFDVTLTPDQVRCGDLNTIALRIVDWYSNGGLEKGPYDIGPAADEVLVREHGSRDAPVAAAEFEMGARPGVRVDVVLKFFGALSEADDLVADYRLVGCFHRTIKAGTVDVKRSGRDLVGVVELDVAESRHLYYAEWFSARGVLRSAKRGPVSAFARYDQKLRYEKRDAHAIAALPTTHEDTPYGKLKLVDVIDCSKDPAIDEHPYKEGGIRASWVGRRAYATWVNGVTVEDHEGVKYREANNNQFFGYRVGRGTLKAHAPYLLRVKFPDNAARYQVMHIKAGMNYQGTGFRTGVSEDDPEVHYPQTGEWQWYDHLVFNDEVTYGYKGARTVSSENGFWVLFHDNGRCYSPQYDAGPAAAEIRLYEIEDIEKHYPAIRYPEGLPRRRLMMDWERKPEAPPYDVARYARFLGLNAISPVIQKWSNAAFWKTANKGWAVPRPDEWCSATREGACNENIWDGWLAGTKRAGIEIMPRVEYGGSESLPKHARAIGPDGKSAKVGRYAKWGANLLHEDTWREFERLMDELIGREHENNKHIVGMLWRMRSDRVVISYGRHDVELFCKETNTPRPKLDTRKLARWASSGEVGRRYESWWHKKRREFHIRLRDKLKTYDKDMVLYYYNWDPDGWNLGNYRMQGRDWSDYYNVNRSRRFYERKAAHQRKLSGLDFVNLINGNSRPHWQARMQYYKDTTDVAFFAPVHWRYLADNEKYIDFFRTGDGLAICNMFNYEEKGRTNVQNDNYQSSEMTPGGVDYGMAEEVLAFFHGDPNVITWTTYTYGRGFVDTHRRFASAFLALPDMRGTEIRGAWQTDPDVKVRAYETPKGIYVSVVNRAFEAKRFVVHAPAGPGAWFGEDLVTGRPLAVQFGGGSARFDVAVGPMQLNSYLLRSE